MTKYSAAIKSFTVFAAPVLKAAFIHAAKVTAYIVLSAALAAAYAYVQQQQFDPTTFAAINVFLAAARKAIETTVGDTAN